MKHFLFLANLPNARVWGGCENQILDYLSRVDYSKTRVTLITNHDVYSARFRESHLPVGIEFFPFEMQEERQEKSLRRIFRFLNSFHADRIVFVNNFFLAFDLAYYVAAWMASRGNVFTLEVIAPKVPEGAESYGAPGVQRHRFMWWFRTKWRWVIRHVFIKKALVVSQELKDIFVKWYLFPHRKISVVFHGIDLNRFRPQPTIRQTKRCEMGIAATDQVILSTSRFSDQKCLDRLILAFAKMCEEYPDLWLVMVGDGPLDHELRVLARTQSCAQRIRFTGFQKDTAPYYQMADIFVLPSDNEGVALCVWEAMHSGNIVIATKTPGPNELMRSEFGILVEKNLAGVTQGLRSALMMSVEEREKMVRKGQEFVMSFLDVHQRSLGALRELGMETREKDV